LTESTQASPHPEDRRAAWRRGALAGLFATVAAALGVYAYAFAFTTFRLQDDEGYFILALRAYRSGHALYDRIDTIYGPFYFQATSAIFTLFSAPIDNVGARWFTIAAWLATSLVACRYVARATESFLAGIVAFALSFAVLASLVSGPLHPGGLDALLLASIALASLGFSANERATKALVACGALAAALTLSKLNAGAFALLAFAAIFARFSLRGRASVLVRFAVHAFACLLPFVLMRTRLGDAQFLRFALVVSLSLAPLCFLGRLAARERPSNRAPIDEGEEGDDVDDGDDSGYSEGSARDARLRILPFIIGAAFVTLAVIGIALFQGTTWSGLARSLVLGTLRFPGAPFVYAPEFAFGPELVLAIAAIPIVFCARARWMAWFGATGRALFELACGAAMIVLACGLPAAAMRALPLVWIAAVPRDDARGDIIPRTTLAWLVVLEALHAFPVAGNQAVLFAFLVPVAGSCVVCRALRDIPRLAAIAPAWRAVAAAALVLALAFLHPTFATAPVLAKQFRSAVPLELPGAESVRLSERRAAELQWVAKNLDRNATTFVGAPGLHSFYVWSRVAPPVPFFTNAWILFFDDSKQEELVRALLASPRPCVVRNRAAIEFWTGASLLADGPFSRMLERDFRAAGSVGEYELMLPRAAEADLVCSILPEPAPSALHARFAVDRVLRLALPPLNGVRIARVVLYDARRKLDVFDSSAPPEQSGVSLVDNHGDQVLRPGSLALVDLSLESSLYLIDPGASVEPSPDSALVRAYDEHGRVVARLLMPNGLRRP
jgi:hypothetical protein